MNKIQVKNLKDVTFPMTVDNIHELLDILEKVSPQQLKELKIKIVTNY